jgi:hypothetical protein
VAGSAEPGRGERWCLCGRSLRRRDRHAGGFAFCRWRRRRRRVAGLDWGALERGSPARGRRRAPPRLLVRASRFEVARRGRALGGGPAGDLDDLAMQAADDALVAILRKPRTSRRQPVHHVGLQVRAARGGREGPPARVGRTRGPARGGRLGAAARSSRVTGRRCRGGRWAPSATRSPGCSPLISGPCSSPSPSTTCRSTSSPNGSAPRAARSNKTLYDARRKLRARLAADGLAVDSVREGATP